MPTTSWEIIAPADTPEPIDPSSPRLTTEDLTWAELVTVLTVSYHLRAAGQDDEDVSGELGAQDFMRSCDLDPEDVEFLLVEPIPLDSWWEATLSESRGNKSPEELIPEFEDWRDVGDVALNMWLLRKAYHKATGEEYPLSTLKMLPLYTDLLRQQREGVEGALMVVPESDIEEVYECMANFWQALDRRSGAFKAIKNDITMPMLATIPVAKDLAGLARGDTHDI